MSERERKLLIMFAAAGVILLSLWGYKSYQLKRESIAIERAQAETELREGQMYLASRDTIQDEIDWLAANEPAPQASELVAPKLQEVGDAEALRAGMTVKKRDPIADRVDEIESSSRYKVAKVKFQVTGEEIKLYAWFDRMHSPNDFRVISEIIMSPNKEDDSKIDCTVTFDQWYVPLTPNL